MAKVITGQHSIVQQLVCRSSSSAVLQLGGPGAADVFLFDMIALSSPQASSALQCLAALLSNKSILKIGWGVREDLSIMKQACGINVEPSLDLQIADIHSRVIRREDHEAQVKRLSSAFFPAREVRKLQIDGIHALSRMDVALQEHKIDAPLKESECSDQEM